MKSYSDTTTLSRYPMNSHGSTLLHNQLYRHY